MKTAKNGFSLIEVLVSIILASFAGLALLEAISQNRLVMESGRRKQEINQLAGINIITMDQMQMSGANEGKLDPSQTYHVDNAFMIEQLHKHVGEFHSDEVSASGSSMGISKVKLRFGDQKVLLYGLSGSFL
ncbi:MAG: hypothetical protein B7Y17_02240 [Sulfuricurvum sp. 24-42-5]|nr:MAG: hypothetical protein B7Y17_02240 [Sulfuricurvum sp. 24-42-5]